MIAERQERSNVAPRHEGYGHQDTRCQDKVPGQGAMTAQDTLRTTRLPAAPPPSASPPAAAADRRSPPPPPPLVALLLLPVVAVVGRCAEARSLEYESIVSWCAEPEMFESAATNTPTARISMECACANRAVQRLARQLWPLFVGGSGGLPVCTVYSRVYDHAQRRSTLK